MDHRFLFAALQLAHKAFARVQAIREHSLAQMMALTKLSDLKSREMVDRCETHCVELTHGLATGAPVNRTEGPASIARLRVELAASHAAKFAALAELKNLKARAEARSSS